MKLIKKKRTYLQDSVEHHCTDLYIVKDNGYKIPIIPKFFNDKRNWRDLYEIAEEENE